MVRSSRTRGGAAVHSDAEYTDAEHVDAEHASGDGSVDVLDSHQGTVDAATLLDAGQPVDSGGRDDAALPAVSAHIIADAGDELALLFVGNSYVNSNNLPNALK